MPVQVENFDGIVVIGAGLSGLLLTICLAKEGYKVKVFDKDRDWRKVKDKTLRNSANLTISHRGRAALRSVGLEDEVLNKLTCPMFGRAIHSLKANGRADSFQPYDEVNRENAIYSIPSFSRVDFGIILMKAADKFPNVELMFKTRLMWIKGDVLHFETRRCKLKGYNTFNDYRPGSLQMRAKLIVGADGGYSTIKSAMCRLRHIDNIRTYHSAGYKYLRMPPDKDGNYALKDSKSLHIWPRGECILTAFPNPDKSFSCTLFAPLKTSSEGLGLNDINTTKEVKEYFAKHFPDVIQFIPNYIKEFKKYPSNCHLVMTKCWPWNINDKIVLIGDAAHAMVPFYGQAVDAAFEDVMIFMAGRPDRGKDE